MNWLGFFRKNVGHREDGDHAPSKSASASAPPELTPPTPPPTPDELRRLLFEAVASGDEQRLETLCRQHNDVILSHTAGWLEVPAAFRATPEAYAWYGNGLRAIARFCAEKVSAAEPLGQLNPIERAHIPDETH